VWHKKLLSRHQHFTKTRTTKRGGWARCLLYRFSHRVDKQIDPGTENCPHCSSHVITTPTVLCIVDMKQVESEMLLETTDTDMNHHNDLRILTEANSLSLMRRCHLDKQYFWKLTSWMCIIKLYRTTVETSSALLPLTILVLFNGLQYVTSSSIALRKPVDIHRVSYHVP
jgi:hypothetical protein